MAFWGKKDKSDKKASAPPPADKAPGPPLAASEPPAPGARGSSASAPEAAPPAGGTTSPTWAAQKTPAAEPPAAGSQPALIGKFGEMVSVMLRSQQHRGMPLAQVESLLMPPLLAGQYVVAGAAMAGKGVTVPVALALWARVSAEVDQRLSSDLDAPMQIAPQEWTSGDITWIIALIGPEQLIAPLLLAVQKNVLGGQPLKMRARDKDGKNIVGTYTGEASAAS